MFNISIVCINNIAIQNRHMTEESSLIPVPSHQTGQSLAGEAGPYKLGRLLPVFTSVSPRSSRSFSCFKNPISLSFLTSSI